MEVDVKEEFDAMNEKLDDILDLLGEEGPDEEEEPEEDAEEQDEDTDEADDVVESAFKERKPKIRNPKLGKSDAGQ